jgi:hypothetical protein
MKPNYKFIAYGAIVALAFMTITSSLVDLSKLLIMLGLWATALLIEKRL